MLELFFLFQVHVIASLLNLSKNHFLVQNHS